MAYVATDAPVAADRSDAGFVTTLFARWKAWRNYRRTLAELNALSDHELEDIGITRGAIPYVARGGK